MNKDLLHLKKLFSKPFRAAKAGGQTNRNYIVTLKKPFGKLRAGKLFVRIPWEGGDVMDRKAEGKNILALSQEKTLSGILPKFFVYVLGKKNILSRGRKEIFDVPDGTMVSEYIAGREFTMKDFRQKKYQKALARMFCTFHKSGVRFQNPYNPFRDEIRKYRVAAQRHPLSKFFDKATLAKLHVLEKEAERKLQGSTRGVATHNDLIFQNFLLGKTGRIYLLDFEYAGRNTKGGIFYDIGYPLRDSFFNPPQISKRTFESFLTQADRVYGKKLDREQIYWSVVAALLVGIWWGILRYLDVPKKERPYFSRYVQRGVKGLFLVAKNHKEKES